MAKLYFRHSTMNAGKSAHVTMTHFNYKQQGKRSLLFTSILDDRYGLNLKENKFTYSKDTDIFDIIEKHNIGDVINLEGNVFAIGLVKSRIEALEEKAIAYDKNTDLLDILEHNHCECVLVDESQFLNKNQVEQIVEIVISLNIPVIAYGLRVDFLGDLFEGSKHLLAYAQKIEELKTICVFCSTKATRNIRVEDGVPTFDGEQIVIGDNANKKVKVGYIPTCLKCERKMKETGKLINQDFLNK